MSESYLCPKDNAYKSIPKELKKTDIDRINKEDKIKRNVSKSTKWDRSIVNKHSQLVFISFIHFAFFSS